MGQVSGVILTNSPLMYLYGALPPGPGPSRVVAPIRGEKND